MFTLLVNNAVFEYPSVVIESSPVRGVSVFQDLPNTDVIPLTISQVGFQCNARGMYLPYYYTLDELYQLVAVTRGLLPVFMGVAYPILFLVILGLISTAVGNLIADRIFK